MAVEELHVRSPRSADFWLARLMPNHRMSVLRLDAYVHSWRCLPDLLETGVARSATTECAAIGKDLREGHRRRAPFCGVAGWPADTNHNPDAESSSSRPRGN